MNKKAEYRQKLKELHPDLNNGDHSRVADLQKVILDFRKNNTLCACGCGRKLESWQFKTSRPNPRFRYPQCASKIINRKRMKAKKLN